MNTTARLSSVALAAVFTVAMLLSVDTLATVDNAQQQVAQGVVTSHS
ncbi:MAG TPA: hypothetical protein VK570_09805 [Rubrivivax sp.]|jgi:hypothetical protein|nr:hypothetical protein [Rubrivivax sp.]